MSADSTRENPDSEFQMNRPGGERTAMREAVSSVLAQELAERLADAERERRAIPQLIHEHPGLDVTTGYQIQQVNFDRRLAQGDQAIGYKLGLTSRAKRIAMGVADPLWGRLSASMLMPEETPIDLSEYIHPRAEPELVFVLDKDVVGPAANAASVLAATKGIMAGIEVLDSRFENFKFTLPEVAADNASAARVIVGGRLFPPELFDCRLEGMALRVNGEVVETAAGAAIGGHPAAAVAWLANRVGVIESGSIVFSGGLTAPVTLTPGTTVTAEYTNLGSVTLQTG